jgi:hypothetical protein
LFWDPDCAEAAAINRKGDNEALPPRAMTQLKAATE